MTNEMTVLISCSYEELNQKLSELNFKIIEQYLVKDIYMINKNIDIHLLTPTLILQNCILVRNIDNKIKKLVYIKRILLLMVTLFPKVKLNVLLLILH